MRFQDKIVLVLGGNSGMGLAAAQMFAAEGGKVHLTGRNQRTIDEAVASISGSVGYAADIADIAATERVVSAIEAADGRIDVLYINAGVGGFAPLAETSDEEWDRILETNLGAAFRITRAALPHLTRGGGHVFMISSLAGQNAIANMSAYCASKAALDHLAACLMLEVRHHGVKVTTIAPGSVDTGFAGRPRGETSWMLRPEDVAEAVLGLLRTRGDAHLSRIEMRPLRPQKRA